ncbi:hypothetical protein [Geodermatophilus sp. SYSU D00710]
MPGDADPRPVKRVWVPQVAVDVDTLWIRTEVAEARTSDPAHHVVVQGVRAHLEKARNAAFRRDPLSGRLANWWRGTLVEAAYRHVHAAEVRPIDLYDAHELQAEIRPAVVRANSVLNPADPRQRTVEEFRGYTSTEQLRSRLRNTVRDSYASLDARQAQLRSFRNILLLAALSITVLMTVTLVTVSYSPTVLPLCFPADADTGAVLATQARLNCPTRSGTTAPSGGDVLVVGLLGLLGGALTAAIAIRNLRGTTVPYDVPVALAMLKVPLGAFTAVLGLVAIRGDFVPGLSALDSQVQILAYALAFGFAQQLLSRLLDRQAQTLLDAMPSKDTGDQVALSPASRPSVAAEPIGAATVQPAAAGGPPTAA